MKIYERNLCIETTEMCNYYLRLTLATLCICTLYNIQTWDMLLLFFSEVEVGYYCCRFCPFLLLQ